MVMDKKIKQINQAIKNYLSGGMDINELCSASILNSDEIEQLNNSGLGLIVTVENVILELRNDINRNDKEGISNKRKWLTNYIEEVHKDVSPRDSKIKFSFELDK
jgi:hypothetical protein